MEDRYIELAIHFLQRHDELVERLAQSKQTLETSLDRQAGERPTPPWAAPWQAFRQDAAVAFPPAPLLTQLPAWAQQRYRLLTEVAAFVQLAKVALRTSQEGYFAAFERGMRRGVELRRKAAEP